MDESNSDDDGGDGDDDDDDEGGGESESDKDDHDNNNNLPEHDDGGPKPMDVADDDARLADADGVAPMQEDEDDELNFPVKKNGDGDEDENVAEDDDAADMAGAVAALADAAALPPDAADDDVDVGGDANEEAVSAQQARKERKDRPPKMTHPFPCGKAHWSAPFFTATESGMRDILNDSLDLWVKVS